MKKKISSHHLKRIQGVYRNGNEAYRIIVDDDSFYKSVKTEKRVRERQTMIMILVQRLSVA